MDSSGAPQEITPEMIAAYDQALAEAHDLLEGIVMNYVTARAMDANEGIPEAATVVNMAVAFADIFDREVTATALASAVVKLVEAGIYDECDQSCATCHRCKCVCP